MSSPVKHSLTLERVVELYPRLLSAKRLEEWEQLFLPGATVVRVECGRVTNYCGLAEAMPEQREYADENGVFREDWDAVEVSRYGSIAVIKADYRLIADNEIREGVDVLTLVNEGNGWKITTLTYEQTQLLPK